MDAARLARYVDVFDSRPMLNNLARLVKLNIGTVHAYIQACKRAGVEPEPSLKSGSLAVLCPSCPQPGINMDPNWRNRSESMTKVI